MPARNIDIALSPGSSRWERRRDRKALRANPKRMSLALQGGGAYGAFTWGVLDRLLEEKISFDAVSGASIGAINATLLASGLAKDGPDGARATLEAFWTKLSRLGILIACCLQRCSKQPQP
jgi:NTE family protein